MVFELSEITSVDEFADLATLLYDSFHEPYNPFFQLLNSTTGTYEEQICAAELRYAASWRANPAQHWIKVSDPASNSIVIGVASWYIQEEVPKDAHEPIMASWHPEGSAIRSYTSEWLEQVEKVSRERMMRPHLEIDQLVTHPAYRRKGVGNMLIDWGLNVADDLSVETFVMAAPFSVPFYMAMGFVQIDIIDPEVKQSSSNEEWKELQSIDKHFSWMWRPVNGGPFTTLPWEQKSA